MKWITEKRDYQLMGGNMQLRLQTVFAVIIPGYCRRAGTQASNAQSWKIYTRVIDVCIHAHTHTHTRTKQGCSVQGSAKSLGSRTFAHLTNLKSVVWSLVKVRRTLKSLSNLTAYVCQNCKRQQPPPVQSHSFLAVKVSIQWFIYEMWNVICILYQARKFPWS